MAKVAAAKAIAKGAATVISFIAGREEARKQEEILDDIRGSLDDLRDDISSLEQQLLANEIGDIEAALNDLGRFRQNETGDDDDRQDIVSRVDSSLESILAQASVILGGNPSIDSVMDTIGTVNYAMAARMHAALALEAGPLGSFGIRDNIDQVIDLHIAAVRELRERIDAELEYEEQLVSIALPFIDGAQRAIVNSGITSNSDSRDVPTTFGQSPQKGRDDVDAAWVVLARNVSNRDFAAVGGTDLAALAEDYIDLRGGLDETGGDGGDRLFGAGLWEGTSEDPASQILANDFLVGQGGDDTITASWGDDNIRGDSGDDELFGERDNDVIVGGPGNDLIDGGDGVDVARYFSRGSENVVTGTRELAQVVGPEGTDTLVGIEYVLFDNDEIELPETGPAPEPAPGPTEETILEGTPGPDSLTATDASTTMFGLAGNDALTGGSSNDTLVGASGNDTLTGGAGDDELDGGTGFDAAVFSGTPGDHRIAISLSFDPGSGSQFQVAVSDKRDQGDGTDTLTGIEALEFEASGAGSPAFETFDQLVGAFDISSAELTRFVEMYVAYFDRAPDAVGLFYWGTRLSEGMTIEEIATSFFVQPESRAIYTDPNNNEALVDTVYDNLLEREAEQEGRDYWIDALQQNNVSRAEFVLAVINGAKAETGTPADAAVVEDKAKIGLSYAAINGLTDVENALEAMAAYDRTDAEASLSEAQSLIEGFRAAAEGAGSDELVVQLVGLIDDPFA